MSEIIGTSPYDNPNPWKEEEIEELIRMYERGKSFGQIGLKLGKTRGQVSSKARRLKMKGLLAIRKPYSPLKGEHIHSNLKKLDEHVIQPDEYDEIPEWTDEGFARAKWVKFTRSKTGKA